MADRLHPKTEKPSKQHSNKKPTKRVQVIKSEETCPAQQQQPLIQTPPSLDKQATTPLKQNKLIWTSEEEFLLMMIRINPEKLSCQLEIPDTSQIEKRCFRMRTSKFQKTLIKIEKFNLLASKYLEFIHKGYKKDHEEFSAVRQSIKKLVDDLWDLMKNSKGKIDFDDHQFNQKLRPEKDSSSCRKKHCPYRLLYTLYWQFRLLHAIHNFDYECIFEKAVIWPDQNRFDSQNQSECDKEDELMTYKSSVGIEMIELQRIIKISEDHLQWPNDLIPKKHDSIQTLEKKKQLSILFVYFTGRYHVLLTATNQVMQVWQQRLKSFYAKDQALQWYKQHIVKKDDPCPQNYNFQDEMTQMNNNRHGLKHQDIAQQFGQLIQANEGAKRLIKRERKNSEKTKKNQAKVAKQIKRIEELKEFKAMSQSQSDQNQDLQDNEEVEYKIFEKNYEQPEIRIQRPYPIYPHHMARPITVIPHREEICQILPTINIPRAQKKGAKEHKKFHNHYHHHEKQQVIRLEPRKQPMIPIKETKFRNSVRFKEPNTPIERSLQAFEDYNKKQKEVNQVSNVSSSNDSDNSDGDDIEKEGGMLRLGKRNTFPNGGLFVPRFTSSGSKIRHNSILSESISVLSKPKNDPFKKSHFQRLQKGQNK